uniref:Phosphoadenosine phosphosulfate reductase n=1 Tax=Paulinella chromatophora TaxID=39717 RepID=B1X562_PAUCH|nr:phosphoadenosine phosphosulfate reductase [Paulinella chromatophora]ACB43081.1 phosphoadenosine phosphosulfate reductase [Paulinella chromatophora]
MRSFSTIEDQFLPLTSKGKPLDLEDAQCHLTNLTTLERLEWGLETFGEGFTLTTSFGIQSAVCLHMIAQLKNSVPIIWVDTGYLPPETYHYVQTLCELLSIQVKAVQSPMSTARMEALYGRLWESHNMEDLETYHQIRKIDPLENAFQMNNISCWASGVRGGQTENRSSMKPIELIRGRWSLRPLLNWTKKDVFYYMQEHNLPQHPLFDLGYSTVGDWHSSRPEGIEVTGRATRFGGLKEECGIHIAE